jgi:hypothetical protein
MINDKKLTLASKWPALVSFSFLKKKPGKGCEATSGLQMACAGFFFISEKETSKGCEARGSLEEATSCLPYFYPLFKNKDKNCEARGSLEEATSGLLLPFRGCEQRCEATSRGGAEVKRKNYSKEHSNI